MSNKWLIDVVNTDFVNHDMLGPANKYGYTLINVEVTGFERDKKIVRTARGSIDYDYLILAGGIRDNYQAWYGEDREAAEFTRKHFLMPISLTKKCLVLNKRLKISKVAPL